MILEMYCGVLIADLESKEAKNILQERLKNEDNRTG